MKKLFVILLVAGMIVTLISCNEDQPKVSSQTSEPTGTETVGSSLACDAQSEKTAKKYNVIGSEIKLRKGPGGNYDPLINEKASKVFNKIQYISIDDSTEVFEECIKGEWSWIRVVEPTWLQKSHIGWVESKFLNKGKSAVVDKYSDKISSSALMPYTEKNQPNIVAKYRLRLNEIEIIRRKAAELSIDTKKCDYVLTSELWADIIPELSKSKEDIHNLRFWVECRNGQRINFDESQIAKGYPIKTQEEKSWSEGNALNFCKKLIKERVLIPSDVDIHTVFGTSFSKSPINHNVVVKMDFDAKNAFGAEIPYTATCYFEPGEDGNVEIQVKLK